MSGRKIYQGHMLAVGRYTLWTLSVLSSIGIFVEGWGTATMTNLLVRQSVLWGLFYLAYAGGTKKTYITLENGLLSQREKWQNGGKVMLKDIVSMRVDEVGFVPPAGRALCVVASTKDNSNVIAFETISYPESEMFRLLRDIKEENPDIEYDAEVYAIMQGRSKYYHGLVNPFTSEFVGDDRDKK
jgi:hypothetical protein